MAGTPRLTVRWWRWRRNPLKRRIDVIEAWLVLILWLCVAAGAALTGLTAGTTTAEYLDRERALRQEVPAVLLEDAKPHANGQRVGSPPVWVTVRWRNADGAHRTGETRVKPGTPAGTRITVWTHGGDRITTRPLSSSARLLQATASGTLAAACAAGVILGAAQAVHGLLDRQRLRQWDKEWERVDARPG